MIAYRKQYDPQSDIETLQTDIMRFMAILGFCLMTIFALVQSIPTGKADARPRLELKQSLEQQVSDLQTFLQELTDKRDQVEAEYQQLLSQQETVTQAILNSQVTMQNQQAQIDQLNTTEQQLQQQSISNRAVLESQLKNIQRLDSTLSEKQIHVDELEQLAHSTQSQLTEVRRKVNREELSLNRIEKQLNQASTTLESVSAKVIQKTIQDQSLSQQLQNKSSQQQEMSETMSQLNRERLQKIKELQTLKAQQKIQQAKRKPVAPIKSKPAPSKKVAAPAVKKPEKKGFSLRFSSDNVLTTLVKRGQVDFFAMTNNQAYRVYNGAFIKATKPRQYHQMAVATVPPIYQNLLKQKYTFYRANSVTWGVALPNQMKREITAITSKHKGGDLVIQSGGKILLEQ